VSFVALILSMRVFLVGYMGVGKSTIGKKISNRLGLKFIDLDKLISQNENLTIPQLIDNKGEKYFRQTERNCLRKVSEMEDVLVATGGGTPCFFDNMELIKSKGVSVYLKLDEKTIIKRISQNLESRPLLKGKSKSELVDFVSEHLKGRIPYYIKSDLVFETINFDAVKLIELQNQILALI
tara:strand:+ start:96804 stop:97346 length:543 start_codon:yes stop_codon:yes gene_type:complete